MWTLTLFTIMTNVLAMHYPTCVGLPSTTSTHNSKDEDEVNFIPPNGLNDWPCFVEELQKMFRDPNVEATVEAKLDVLCMWTNQKFADFLVDFNTLSSQVNWGDCTLCHRLKLVLPDHIKDLLVLVEEPATFNEWKHLVQNIDQQYWE